MSQPHGPLHGVKVVTCSTAQAGTVPYMLMADLGAEVIKIEVPEGGDPSRGSTVLLRYRFARRLGRPAERCGHRFGADQYAARSLQ